ncbi:unnamed protein product [Lactuca virosa]|uniref:Uncharacterized protein n=1 Tax=Lactuca virosa TaxID=75947 RepID=A0AAU9M7A2_9ASTR|nr:unnamed protein product [Lactuca virosa]
MHTSNFMVSGPTKFSFIGSIPEAMLLNVLVDNRVVKKPTDEQHEETPKIDPKVNEDSVSKGKEKQVDDDDKVEEEVSDGENLIRKKRDKVLDDLMFLRKELEAKEVEAEVAKVTLATQQTLFPP